MYYSSTNECIRKVFKILLIKKHKSARERERREREMERIRREDKERRLMKRGKEKREREGGGWEKRVDYILQENGFVYSVKFQYCMKYIFVRSKKNLKHVYSVRT